ncbi:MAG TPA: PHB depolymerase family esterase [bacterium]|nr:PHB depolymerase family esterase [bacterium]HPG47287.1 PHB depolymerase family esterase [bacterium]HPM99507.1 PHB depolymerase family esterase [bacterium]
MYNSSSRTDVYYHCGITGHYFLLMIVLFVLPPAQAQTQRYSFEFEGETREYLVFLPQNFKANMPVVFNLHGYTDNAQWQMDYSLMNEVADTAGFILVYPEAIYPGFNTGLVEPNWIMVPPDVNDVGLISAIIDTLKIHYDIDMKRIYCCGYSNGGIMTNKLACQLRHRFAAIAPVSATLIDTIANTSRLFSSLPILMCNGTKDDKVTYNGNIVKWSVEKTLNFWIENNSCILPADSVALPDTCSSDSCRVEKFTYSDALGEPVLVFYKIIDGGHAWPSSGFTGEWAGNTNRDINASVEIWNFFKDKENPYAELAWGQRLEIQMGYLVPAGDTLQLTAIVRNPANHPVSVQGIIQQEESAFKDSLQLFDDGAHGDGEALDNVWGGLKWLAGLEETTYRVNLNVNDLAVDIITDLCDPDYFSTIGPVELRGYQIGSYNSRFRRQSFTVELENKSASVVAEEISATLSTTDTRIQSIPNATVEFGDIGPGQKITCENSFAFCYTPEAAEKRDSLRIPFTLAINSRGHDFWTSQIDFALVETIIHQKGPSALPARVVLNQNYPNPFNVTTTISFDLPTEEHVRLDIFDVRGSLLSTLINEKMAAGHHAVNFSCQDYASGLFYYKLMTGENIQVGKALLLK